MKKRELKVQGQVSPEAQELFESPLLCGPLEEWDGRARLTGSCGDTMEFWLKIEHERIVKASFTTSGCGPSRAAGSMAAQLAVGLSLVEAMDLQQAEILEALGGLPRESEHCAGLAAATLHEAVHEYCRRHRTAK